MKVLLACALLLSFPVAAGAELVRLSSGRILEVETLRFQGDMVFLVLRSGGQAEIPKSLVAEVMADEVPYASTVALELVAMPRSAGSAATVGDIRDMVTRLATQFGVPVNLALAVVQVESNYQARAVSPKGAVGLMQLMPVLVQAYALVDPFDPEKNVEAGLRHLRGLLDRFDRSTALAAYNAGEGAVSRYGGIPPFSETREYVKRVLALAGSSVGAVNRPR